LGISISEFYCCGKLKTVHVNIGNEGAVKCNKDDSKTGCCQTNQEFFKVKDSHLTVSEIHAPARNFSEIDEVISFFELNTVFETSNGQVSDRIHAPPPDLLRPLYILNCVYRI
jgi:hypothetical protein